VWIVSARAGFISISGRLHANVAIGAAIRVDEDGVLAPPLCEIQLPSSIRTRIRRGRDQRSFRRGLPILKDLLQPLESTAFVHEWHTAIAGRDIVRSHARIDSCARWIVKWRRAVEAANAQARWRAAIDVLLVPQFVIVVGGVVALAREEGLKAILSTDVHR